MGIRLATAKHCLFLIFLAALLPAADAAEEESELQTAMDFFQGEPDTDYPQTSPLLVNATGRSYRSLNGPWEIIIDEAGMGWRFITQGDYLTEENLYPNSGMSLVEHSFDSRRQLQVPGDWNSQVPELDRYRSRVLYHKAVDLQPEPGRHYFLHFGGSNYTTDLFVNNRLVGRHTGGYTSFNFDITDFIKAGRNRFIVRVDAQLDESTIPTMRTSDFWKYGGLIGDVGLVQLPDTYIAQYHLYLQDLASGEIAGWVQLGGSAVASRSVAIAIPELGVSAELSTDPQGRGKFRTRSDKLQPWSPTSPKLYQVALSLDGATVQDRIGFRTVSTDGLKILLNGEPVQIRGISMHEETVLHPGMSTSREDVLAQFKLVKELNANFVRLAHYPHNEHTLKLADEMGLMIWSEVPIVSLIDWDNPATLAVARSQVSENVTRDMNRASIITWSVSNESFPQSQARLDFLSELARTARRLDASGRPVASALVGGGEEFAGIAAHLIPAILAHPQLGEEGRQKLLAALERSGHNGGDPGEHRAGGDGELLIEITDPLGEVVDIVGYNEYFGWYYSGFFARTFGLDPAIVRDAMISIMPTIRFRNSFGKPIIVSEFGAGAKQGLRSEEGLLWSEEYQARVYRAQLDMLAKSHYVVGFSPWVLKDFRSHLRELNGIQETYNRKGLVSETGEKKLAFKLLADHYAAMQQGE